MLVLVIAAFLNVGRVELYWEVLVGRVLGWCLEAAGRVRSCARELATLECGFRAAGGSQGNRIFLTGEKYRSE